MGKEDRGSPVLIPSIWSICEHSHCSASAAAWQVLRGRWWKFPSFPKKVFPPGSEAYAVDATHNAGSRPPQEPTLHASLPARPSHKLCASRSWYSVGREEHTVCTSSTFALICLWYVCFLVFSFSRSFLFPIFLWQTTVNRLTEHIRDWHTQRELCWMTESWRRQHITCF